MLSACDIRFLDHENDRWIVLGSKRVYWQLAGRAL